MSLLLIGALVLLIPVLAIFLDSDVGKALAKRLERGSRGTAQDGTQQRLEFLEAETERLGKQVEVLEEETQFLHKLLEGRSEPRAIARPGAPSGRGRGEG